jgi:transcriptional regulator
MESMINEMVDTYEASYKDHWHSLSQDEMMHNIVGFEMIVNRLEGKYKLSQKRSQLDQKTVSDSLIENSDPMIRNLGLEMKHNFDKFDSE